MKETQIERLKASLDDSISSHRKALDEKEDIVEDLKTVRAHARVSGSKPLDLHMTNQGKSVGIKFLGEKLGKSQGIS